MYYWPQVLLWNLYGQIFILQLRVPVSGNLCQTAQAFFYMPGERLQYKGHHLF